MSNLRHFFRYSVIRQRRGLSDFIAIAFFGEESVSIESAPLRYLSTFIHLIQTCHTPGFQ